MKAYQESHPDCRSYHAAGVGAHSLLKKPKIIARLEALKEARWKRLQMTGDEALMLVAQDARADLTALYDDAGELLPPKLWPDSLKTSVKAYRPGPFGATIVLNDSLAARRIVLEQTGKIRGVGDAVDSLAAAIRGDQERSKEESEP